ncbi:acyl-CoA thioesterase [soil metagenome]
MHNDGYIAVQLVMMPKDANPFGTIFGGVILSNIDVAGSVAARRAVLKQGGIDAGFVTVAINKVEFKKPVLVGDTVRFVCTVVRVGRTSITMHIDVIAERGKDTFSVTAAEVVYVGVDPAIPVMDRKPLPLFPSVTV